MGTAPHSHADKPHRGWLRDSGQGAQRLTPEDRRALSALFWTHVNPYGEIAVDIERELAQLGPSGYRPLRQRGTR